HVAGSAVFVSNFVLWNEIGYFDTAASTKHLLHLWSLAVEEQFYLIWPLMLWAAWKKRWTIQTAIWLVLGASFFFNVEYVDGQSSATFYLPHARFWELS